ncbi:MAG: enoyl-CoA hydratase [Caldilineaceae bacterium]
MSQQIIVSQSNRILQIQINRPEKRNALTQEMYSAMNDAIAKAESDSDTRVILFRGHESAFTAGNDILDFVQSPPAGEDSPVFRFLRAISTAKKPLVAAVNGVAVGIGTTLLLHCDLVYAGQSARFQLPFVNLGLVPEAGSSWILPQMVGQRRAAELLLLGDAFDATTAHSLGIVNKVIADGDVLSCALSAAEQLAAKPPSALRLSKQLMKQHSDATLQAIIGEEGRLFAEQLLSEEAAEALQAFLEKRKPDFSRFS